MSDPNYPAPAEPRPHGDRASRSPRVRPSAPDQAAEVVESGSVAVPAFITDGCEARVRWSGPERRLLGSLPDPGEPVEHEVWCGLEHGHPGLHWALGQVSGDVDFWWLRWDEHLERREFVHHPVCRRYADATAPGEPGVPCDLPRGHPGAHSYTRPA